MPQNPVTLKQYLSRWNYHTVPDYYYEAWRILFWGSKYPNEKDILTLAEKDMLEESHLRPLATFDNNRRTLAPEDYQKWNWGQVWK